MKMSRRLIPLVATVIVLMMGSRELLAQQSGSLFTERFGNVFDPASRTYYSLQSTQGEQFGGQQPFTSFGATHHVGSIDDDVTLFNGQLQTNNNGNLAGTVGAQQRWMTTLPVLDTSILGAGLYLDANQSRYDNLFQQININLELMTESAWVARGNAYLPVGQIQQTTGLQTTTGGAPGQLAILGTTVGFGGINHQLMDVALMGSELELGRKFFNYRTEVYGGYYNWNGPLAGFTNGVKGGVRGYITDNLSGNVNVSHDSFFGTNVYGGLTYFFGGSGGSRPMSFANLMTLPAQRAQQVSIGNFIRDVNTFQAALNATTGEELHLYFVQEAGAGGGTQADPSSVNSVLADTQFGNGSVMVLLDANGNITAPIALTHDGQQIIGGGSTGTASVDFSLALGQAPGTTVIGLSGLGGRPVLAPTAGNAVTLTNQNLIQGFTIDGSGGITNGISGNPGAVDTVVNDMIIRNVAGTGIRIQPSTNTTVSNTTFQNNGVDLLLNAANSTITNVTSTGAINGAINLGGNGFGSITGTTQIFNVNITGAGGFGGILLNGAGGGAIINLTDVSVTGGTGSGVTVTNSFAGSIYNLTNVDVLNVGANGLSLQTSYGTFNINNTSSITDPGAAAFAINGGSINVNFGGSLSQANAASAVSVTGNHTGTVNFNAISSIVTTLGDGLQFDGADGTYNFLGTTNMNGGDAGIDIFNSNGAFVFTNPFINNTASGMGVKIVGGGGDSPVTMFHGLNIATSGNAGFFVSNGGLTTVTGTANVNTVFGTAVDLQGTSLAATFTNLTSDQGPTTGININNASGTFGVTGMATVTNAAANGVNVSNSTADVTVGQLNVDGAVTGINLLNNTAGGFTVTGVGGVGVGGTIQNVTDRGVLAVNNFNTSLNNMIIDASGGTRGVGVIATAGIDTFSLTNSTVTGGTEQAVGIGADLAGVLNATVSGNTLAGTGASDAAGGFAGITSAAGFSGGTLNLAFSGNTLSSTSSAGAYISNYNPLSSTTGGTVTVTDFANNTVTTSNAGGSSGPLTGGIRMNGVTFDADLSTAGIQTVNGGALTIGSVGTPTNVVGDGLQLNDVTGALAFTTMNIGNDDGTGLYVNTKLNNTTFSLTNSGGAINTTNGVALFLDPLAADLTFTSVSSTNSMGNGLTLDAVSGSVNLGNVSVTNAAGSGLLMDQSSAAVTAGTVTINGAATGLTFGNNVGGSFTTTGLTDLSNLSGTGVDLNGSAGTYTFADLNLTTTGANTGLDFRNSNVLFTSANTTITGDGAAGSIGIDLSGTLNPNGANSTTPNIQLANAAGQTAIINNVDTGILLGNVVDGSAGAYLVYGNQTPLNSGSQINATAAGVTLDTTNLTSTNGFTQGRYEFLGVNFTGIASFQKSNNLIFVGSTSSGTDDGSSPLNRISGAELLALDATPSNLDGKTVVLVNDNGGAGIDLSANTLTLGDNTILDSFGNGQTFSTGGVLPVNVIVDTITGSFVFSDPNGAATLTNDGSINLVTLGNGDTIQNVILDGGTNTVFGSGVAGVNINNTTIGGSSLAGISLTSTTGTIGLTQNTISGTGTDGILLSNAGTVSINGGTINSTGDDGIHSSDTNLTVTGVTIGDTGQIDDDGIQVINSGTARMVNLSNNQITAADNGIRTTDTGVAGELLLTLDGNTLQSLGGGFGLRVDGSGLNSTIIRSMNGGTVNGPGGGVLFNRVTFDASGTALSGTQVNAGNWTIGTAGNRIYGDGLVFDAPTGDLKFGTLNIANNYSVGLGVWTTPPGTTFILGNTGGTVDTTNGVALFLGSLTADLTFGTVSSTNSSTTGVTLDAVSGTVNINTLNVILSDDSGLLISNSKGLTSTIQTVNINGAGTVATDNGVTLADAGTVNILGGTIKNTTGDGVHSTDTNLTATGLTIGGIGTITGDGVEIVNNGTAHTVNLSNNTITANASGISTVSSDVIGELVLTLDGNTLQSLNGGSLALSVNSSGLNSTIVRSMNGGTVIGNGTAGGVLFNRVNFDASGTALSGTQVNGGNWTIGTTGARVQGDGLRFDTPTGDLAFGTLNIANNGGTGLYVDTKTFGTTFSLGSTDGTIDTTAGAALFLDPLTTDLTFGTVTSTNSTGNGVTFDAVSGSVNIGTLNVSNSDGDGVLVNNSNGTIDITGGSITGTTNNAFHVSGGSSTVNYGGSISNASGQAVRIENTVGGSTTFGGTLTDNGPGLGIRLTNNAGAVTFNGDVSLGATMALSNEAVYLTGNSGNITFENLDVNVNTGSALGAIYGLNNSQITIGGGNVTSVGAAGLNIEQSRINITLDSITASGGTNGVLLTNLAGGSTLDVTNTTVSGVESDGIVIDNSLGTYTFDSVAIDSVGSNLTHSAVKLTNSGTVNILGGTIDNSSGDGIRLNNVSSFTLNNTFVENTSGFTLNSTGSGLSGSGNTATSFSGNDGGGNTGSISFNGGANVFP
ncbi:MAG: right-handed parallel beta-helix repeat-containing protein [Planctomycetota bacterium]